MNSGKSNSNHFSSVSFVSSSALERQLPNLQGDEFALLGRSNVGKSSFINHVFNTKNLARVSKTPGKTTLANIYKIDNSLYFVDLPGYGYAKSSFDEKKRWSKLIYDYCVNRKNLLGLFWLIDIRHIGVKTDLEAKTWIDELGIQYLPLLTKADKLSRSGIITQTNLFKKTFGSRFEPVIYSTHEGKYREIFWKRFTEWHQELKV